LHRYRLAEDGSMLKVPADIYPVMGCDWELAEVRAARETWWTMAFESFGPKDGLRTRLFAVTEEAFRAGTPPALGAADSWSYPKWLASLARLAR
jgi:hypothetical protein